MASDRELHPGDPVRPGGRAPHRWPVWRLPPLLVGVVLLVETIAIVLLVGGVLGRAGPTPAQLWTAGSLCALGVACIEVSVGVERERRRLGGAGDLDSSVDSSVDFRADFGSVWTFAAALSLPGAYAAVVATIIMLYLWARAWRSWVPLHRQLFGVAAVVLACITTGAFLERVDPAAGPAEYRLWVLLLAIVLYLAINVGLLAAFVTLRMQRGGRSALPGPQDEYLLELAVLCLGALAAIALALNPLLVILALLPLHVVLRAVLVRPLEAAASTDGKTGLLNAATWITEAERVLGSAGAERAGGVLVIDLDHFKAVNDTHGHAVGDRVLAAVADALRRGVRARDLVGRLGGEEFVVMPRRTPRGPRSIDLESVELEVVAERIRTRVAELRVEVPTLHGPLTIADLSVSIGGAVAAADGSDLAALLHTADAALYAAKRAGRNTVRVEVASSEQPVPVHLAGRGGQPAE